MNRQDTIIKSNRRAIALCLLGAIGLLVPLAFTAHARAATSRRRPDLVVSSLSARGSLTVGSQVSAKATTRNIGKRRAGASQTRLYLSVDRSWSTDDTALASASIPGLDPGKSVTKTLKAKVPATTPPAGELVACADAANKVTESNETNNCRAMPDSDNDGWANFTDCAPDNPNINPSATDEPDVPNFRDTNCDGIDGDARGAVFVSPIGDDAASGTKAHPKRTLAAALSSAASQGKDVYATFGTYTELLNVANGVGVYGGYSTTWKRSLSNVTKITGATNNSVGAVANDVTSPTTLQLLTLAPGAPNGSGENSYGLRGANSSGLLIDHATVHAAAGTNGASGANGAPGIAGGDGHAGGGVNDPLYQAGGTSAVGHTGGRGGNGGYYLQNLDAPPDGQHGGDGLSTTPDAWGLRGGLGGAGGHQGSTGAQGAPGGDGSSGIFLGNASGGTSANASPGSGFWFTEDGGNGPRGTDGHGGGGGGGGGGEDCICFLPDSGGNGGGGGGGGQGGGGGAGGHGGGGSFGIFLISSAGAVIRDSVVTASDGGAGGGGGAGAPGGAGGTGGSGGPGDPSGGDGGKGGNGGSGAHGGDGGGGSGGPSVAIYGLGASDAPGTTVSHSSGGAGAPGGFWGRGDFFPGGPGADGVAANYLPTGT